MENSEKMNEDINKLIQSTKNDFKQMTTKLYITNCFYCRKSKENV